MKLSEYSREIVAWISEQVQQVEAVNALWLSGSYGRGEADAFSDFDFYCVALNEQTTDEVFNKLKALFIEDERVIFTKTIPSLKIINLIDSKWKRVDVTVLSFNEINNIYVSNCLFIYDYMGAQAAMKQALPPRLAVGNSAEVEAATNEFIRVLGLLPVALGRADNVLAQLGSGLLRDILIKSMLREGDDGIARGMLSLKKSMPTEYYSMLEKAPLLSIKRSDIIAYNQYLAEIFIPLARKQFAERNIAWPHKFYEFTRLYLSTEIGIKLATYSAE